LQKIFSQLVPGHGLALSLIKPIFCLYSWLGYPDLEVASPKVRTAVPLRANRPSAVPARSPTAQGFFQGIVLAKDAGPQVVFNHGLVIADCFLSGFTIPT
jgi:hypothetical protein